ncbi:hypothetical protein LQU92_12395 [Kocuria sp. LUK]|uniref:hypothetical protein n=1 Tax=Kocuria TaxID=57493 RepID=UPI001E5A3042|nr:MULTISPECIES: hypothetical protein [Kocuria]MCD1146025.1 hypothetical protein [Kocuria sp. LUK]MCJ8505125.1 hypothetical protein [Kocuria flava]
MVERGSTKHGAELDEQMKHEVQSEVDGVQPDHVEEHRQTEAWVDETDDPEVRAAVEERERAPRPDAGRAPDEQ